MKSLNITIFSFVLALWQLFSCGSIIESTRQLPRQMSTVVHNHDPDKAVPNSYIVSFKTGSRKIQSDFQTRKSLYLHYAGLIEDQFFYGEDGVDELDFLTAVDHRIDPESEWEWLHHLTVPLDLMTNRAFSSLQDSTVGLLSVVQFKDKESAVATLDRWSKSDRIWFAEPNYLSQQMNNYSEYQGYFEAGAAEWLTSININAAYSSLVTNAGSTKANPIVAVLDSGVDWKHAGIEGRMFENKRIGLSGCKDDQYGCNTTTGKKDVLGDGEAQPAGIGVGEECPGDPGSCPEKCCHGTHVAGIIAANPTDSDKMVGVCPMCQIISVRLVDSKKGTIADSSILRGLIYITRFETTEGQAIRVVNMSIGKFDSNRAVGAMIRALKSKGNGILVVAAAGNEDTMRRAYPAAFPDVVAVSNVSASSGEKAKSSNFGPWVDVAGPGIQIYSAVPGGRYEDKSGTSMSSPVVAGIAGLILSAEPNEGFGGLRNRLIGTANATKLYADTTYYPKIGGATTRIPLLGTGYIDANAAVTSDFSGTIASAEANKRVDEGCGFVNASSSNAKNQWLLIVLVLFPFLATRFIQKHF